MALLDDVDEVLYPALEPFFENVRDDLEALFRYREEDNREGIRKIARGIEQSASVFELGDIARTGRELAEAAGEGDREAIDRKLQLVSDTLRAAREEFEREYEA